MYSSTLFHVLMILQFQMRKGESKTVFSLKTEKRSQLPVKDFYPKDYGLPHQAFGFEIGPVCFR